MKLHMYSNDTLYSFFRPIFGAEGRRLEGSEERTLRLLFSVRRTQNSTFVVSFLSFCSDSMARSSGHQRVARHTDLLDSRSARRTRALYSNEKFRKATTGRRPDDNELESSWWACYAWLTSDCSTKRWPLFVPGGCQSDTLLHIRMDSFRFERFSSFSGSATRDSALCAYIFPAAFLWRIALLSLASLCLLSSLRLYLFRLARSSPCRLTELLRLDPFE